MLDWANCCGTAIDESCDDEEVHYATTLDRAHYFDSDFFFYHFDVWNEKNVNETEIEIGAVNSHAHESE